MRRILAAAALVAASCACNSGSNNATAGGPVAATGASGTTGAAGAGTGSGTGTSGTGGTTGGAGPSVGLWIGGSGMVTATQLQSSFGNETFEDTCPQPNGFEPQRRGAAVFDGNGNLYVDYPEGNDHIYIWSPAELALDCNPDGGIELSSSLLSAGVYDAVGGMAFDSQGTLWVTAPDSARVLGFAASELTKSGEISPSWALTSMASDAGVSLGIPLGVAFDSAGNLWVGNGSSIVAFSPATLAAATSDGGSGLATVADLAITTAPLDDAGAPLPLGVDGYDYQYVTFDHAGNLWVTLSAPELEGTNSEILEFSAGELGSLAGDGQPEPQTTLSAGAIKEFTSIQFSQIAFDSSGEMWVGFAESQPNVFGYATGAAAPEHELTVLGGAASSLAFNPIPPGLPIYP